MKFTPAKSDGVKSINVTPNPKKKSTPALDKYRKKKGC